MDQEVFPGKTDGRVDKCDQKEKEASDVLGGGDSGSISQGSSGNRDS